MAKVNSITLRAGHVIEHNNKVMVVLKHEIMQCQQRTGTIQLDLRDVRTGNKDNIRFKTGEMVDRVRLDQADCQFLYANGDEFTFMDNTSYEQFNLSRELIGFPADFLQDGMQVVVESYEGEPLRIELPAEVTMEISETEPVVKGQTAASSYKPAILTNGVRVMVPPFISAGDSIIVKTEDGSYVGRAKD